MVKAKVWIKQKEFEGFPTNDHFKLVKEDLPDLKDGGRSSIFFKKKEKVCLIIRVFSALF